MAKSIQAYVYNPSIMSLACASSIRHMTNMRVSGDLSFLSLGIICRSTSPFILVSPLHVSYISMMTLMLSVVLHPLLFCPTLSITSTIG